MLLQYYVIRVLCYYTIAISQQILFYIQTDCQYITSFLKQRIQPCSSNLHTTLSKILCKWKQDSVVSLFLYLDSVFKHKHKLIHNQAPVMNRLCPFLLNLHK